MSLTAARFVPGAGALILEDIEHAEIRDTKIYG